MTAVSSVSGNAAPAPAQSRSTPVLTSDFETFLKMLTAQARYQDPLEPIDSTEYAAQLAQFSMVEQQVLTNATLSAVLGANNLASLSGWIGKEVRAAMPASFTGSPVSVWVQPAFGADTAILVVTDETGTAVQRTAILPDAGPVDWAGVAEDGTPIRNGLYSFSVESYRDGEMILSQPAETYARVTEAQVANGKTVLILLGGQTILSSAATALRDPAS